MISRCPLCGQTLPKGLDEHDLQHRIQELASPALASEKLRLEKSFRTRLLVERESARVQAERKLGREFEQLRQRAERAEKEKSQAMERARRQAERTAALNVANEVRAVTRESEAKLEKLAATREKERLRYEADRTRLQTQFETISRKFEKQTGEQLGDEGEADLFALLKEAFPGDRIERVGRGTKGADIVQQIIDEGKTVGRIVYESKNVSSWQNKFIAQAKRCQAQYDTPNVMIVTRAFPRKKKGLCILKNVPIVAARMAVPLASVIRAGVLEIARLRLTRVARESKTQDLFDYILSDKFGTRFREIADSVSSLRDHQQKERDWHEHAWESETKNHDRIDARRREIDVQIKGITRGSGVRELTLRRAATA